MVLYFFKSTVLLFVFFMLFKWNLENKKSLQFIRFYLLASLFLAFVIPLFSFQFLVQKNIIVETKNLIYEQIADVPFAIVNSVPKDQFSIITTIYIVVSIIFFIRFLFNLYKIYSLRKSGRRIESSFGSIVVGNKITSPFTFLNFIYLNEEDWKDRNIHAAILYHEQAHLKQLHSIDILVIELLKIIFWYQPFLYYFKRIMQENHEYLADEFSLQKTKDVKHYQKLIVDYYSNNQTIVALSSSIHFNNLKKRFIMMKHKTKGRVWETVFYSSAVLITYIGFVGIEAKASEIKFVENKVTGLIEETVKQPQKVLSNLEKVVAKEVIKENKSKVPIIKFIEGQKTAGYLQNPVDNITYYYIVSSEKEVSIYNRYGVLQDIKKFEFTLKKVSSEEWQKEEYEQKKQIEQNAQSQYNAVPVLMYNEDKQTKGYFYNVNDKQVYYYLVSPKKEVSIYNRNGIKQKVENFTYKLEKSKNEIDLDQQLLETEYENKKKIEEQTQGYFPKPSPKEGWGQFYQNFVKEFNMPKTASPQELKIKLRFIVKEDGSFADIKGSSFTNKEVVDEAIRVLKTMPNWNPAYKDGNAIEFSATLPVEIKKEVSEGAVVQK